MNLSKRFTVFFLLVMGVSFACSGILYMIQLSLQVAHPEVPLKPFTFSKILSRTATIVLFLSLVWFRKNVDKQSLRSLGLDHFQKHKQEILWGFFAGILSLTSVVLLKWAFAGLVWSPKDFGLFDLGLMLYFILSVFCIAFVEELFFRGYLLQSFVPEWGPYKAALATSLFFSATHFIRPIHDPILWIPEFIGLFLVGFALCLGWIYTKSLYLSIGIHAGWVYVVKMQSFFWKQTPNDLNWWFGGERLVSGPIAWICMGIFLVSLQKIALSSSKKTNIE